uniref:NADPH-dependent FMN reductase-like domain-containing protein n=1 Tax=Rhodosorus marinus TaxID=101924 RepID=A0A7S0G4B8_9RHOD|mmetsp:Transcript_5120/g.7086  ORF Transcript_5120/g.7086 Transcript_5120/m.7086 type:complete len:223 (+) Transcript_5120:75-743(+)
MTTGFIPAVDFVAQSHGKVFAGQCNLRQRCVVVNMTAAGKLKVLGISGSIRKASANSGLLRAAKEVAPNDVEFEIADISRLPIFNSDLVDPDQPAEVVEFKEKVKSCDAIFFATPEYNFSVTPVLKNAIDWCSNNPNVLNEKPCTMGSCGGGGGGALGQIALRNVLVFPNVHPLNKPQLLIKLFDGSVEWDKETGDIKDEKWRGRIKAQVEALAVWARRINP